MSLSLGGGAAPQIEPDRTALENGQRKSMTDEQAKRIIELLEMNNALLVATYLAQSDKEDRRFQGQNLLLRHAHNMGLIPPD